MIGVSIGMPDAVLLIPLGSAVVLACLPGYRFGARLNVVAAGPDAGRGAVAALRAPSGAEPLSARRRPQHRLHRAQHLRRLHHQRLQRELRRARAPDRPAEARLSALLSRHVSDPDVRHEPGAVGEQHRADVGRDRDCHADHRHDGRHLSHPRSARGGLEILHPRQRRHRARAVRHHPRLCRRGAGDRRRPSTPWYGPSCRPAPRPSIRRC